MRLRTLAFCVAVANLLAILAKTEAAGVGWHTSLVVSNLDSDNRPMVGNVDSWATARHTLQHQTDSRLGQNFHLSAVGIEIVNARMIGLFLGLFSLLLAVSPALAQRPTFPLKAKKILFLGDSITHAGHYIALIEAQLSLASDDPPPVLINLGLPSETCSGLSEPDHPFPRPNVHERIDRGWPKSSPTLWLPATG